LKDDLKKGCLMPPIVLAYAANIEEDAELIPSITRNKNQLIILDGLQRSYTIRDLIKEIENNNERQSIYNNTIRIEIYTGINKLGILYRMLTLNTGQTPMSTRHQIEIIYSDYINNTFDPDIKLLREVDEQSPKSLGEYRYRDIIEGFTSFLERDYLTLERTDILESIKSLENLSTIDSSNELFECFIKTYNSFVKKIDDMTEKSNIDVSDLILGSVFGKNAVSVFNKSQSLTGFGYAIGKLIDRKAISNIEDVAPIIESINDDNMQDSLKSLLNYLDKVRSVAKKIGNDQRLYFAFFFRSLFDSESDGYKNIFQSAEVAFKQYERQTM
jgi:hypothetical protein